MTALGAPDATGHTDQPFSPRERGLDPGHPIHPQGCPDQRSHLSGLGPPHHQPGKHGPQLEFPGPDLGVRQDGGEGIVKQALG